MNEKASKTSIKTTIVGKDAQMSEYWFFKDAPTKLYIRKERKVPIKDENLEMADLEAERCMDTDGEKKVDSDAIVEKPRQP